jgi:hypothetical protein
LRKIPFTYSLFQCLGIWNYIGDFFFIFIFTDINLMFYVCDITSCNTFHNPPLRGGLLRFHNRHVS